MDESYVSPYYRVSINGSELDLERLSYIQSISAEENANGSDSCTLVINDPDFIFIEDNIFIKEVPVTVAIGITGYEEYVFNGYISAIDISFPDSGVPTLSIFCLDRTHLMNTRKKSRTWSNISRGEVARKIAAEYGLNFVLQQGYAGKVEDTISQSDSTDIDFLESMAGEENELYLCKVRGDSLYYLKMGVLENPSVTLYYREYPYDILSFSPQITKEDIKESVSVADVSTNTKQVDSKSASPSDSGVVDDVVSNDGCVVEVSSDAGASASNYVYDSQTGTWVPSHQLRFHSRR